MFRIFAISLLTCSTVFVSGASAGESTGAVYWIPLRPETHTGFESPVPGVPYEIGNRNPVLAGIPALRQSNEPPGSEPRKSGSLWKPLLIAEAALAAYSSLGFIDRGEILAGANAAGGGFTAGHALFHPGQDVTREAQLTLALGWVGLAVLQFDQVDRDAPNGDIVLGNIIGFHALALAGLGVEWVASRLHDGQ